MEYGLVFCIHRRSYRLLSMSPPGQSTKSLERMRAGHVWFLISLLVLSQGCSQAILVMMLNSSGGPVVVNDFRKGSVQILSGDAALVDPGSELTIKASEGVCSFGLRDIPGKYVHSAKRWMVLY